MHYYSGDDTEATYETAAHVAVYRRTRSGVVREDYAVVLAKEEERKVVATVTIE